VAVRMAVLYELLAGGPGAAGPGNRGRMSGAPADGTTEPQPA
jgi:hypothetical protein